MPETLEQMIRPDDCSRDRITQVGRAGGKLGFDIVRRWQAVGIYTVFFISWGLLSRQANFPYRRLCSVYSQEDEEPCSPCFRCAKAAQVGKPEVPTGWLVGYGFEVPTALQDATCYLVSAFILWLLLPHLPPRMESLKLKPGTEMTYANLVNAYLLLDRLDEAKAKGQEARAQNLDGSFVDVNVYTVDFLQHNATGMEREVAELMREPGYEALILYAESDTAAYGGQFEKARELTRRAVDYARRADEKDGAAAFDAEAGVRRSIGGQHVFSKTRGAGRTRADEWQRCRGCLGYCTRAGRRFLTTRTAGGRC